MTPVSPTRQLTGSWMSQLVVGSAIAWALGTMDRPTLRRSRSDRISGINLRHNSTQCHSGARPCFWLCIHVHCLTDNLSFIFLLSFFIISSPYVFPTSPLFLYLSISVSISLSLSLSPSASPALSPPPTTRGGSDASKRNVILRLSLITYLMFVCLLGFKGTSIMYLFLAYAENA